MDWQVIISNTENINEVYLSFSATMQKYLETMKKSVEEISSSVSNLGHYWVGEDYNEFNKSMTKAMQLIYASLDRGERLRGAMIDAQKQLAEALAKMRTSFGGK